MSSPSPEPRKSGRAAAARARKKAALAGAHGAPANAGTEVDSMMDAI